MELLTDKGGISSQQAAEANRAYEDIALSSVKDYSSQSVCSVALGAALGDEADRKRILRARAVVEEHEEVVAKAKREGDALIREAEDLVKTIERGF
jgi:3-oxoacyl-ACP reductase-like protein